MKNQQTVMERYYAAEVNALKSIVESDVSHVLKESALIRLAAIAPEVEAHSALMESIRNLQSEIQEMLDCTRARASQ